MNQGTKKWLARIGLATLCLGLAASGYGLYRLDGERKQLYKEVESLTSRTELLQKKFFEQKAVAEAMRKATMEVESRARTATTKLAQAEQEQEKLKAVISAGEEKMRALHKAMEEASTQQQQQLAAAQSSLENLREESNRVIREKNEQLTSLNADRDRINASLLQETHHNKRCREYNARFAQLSEELVHQYENKGVLKSLGEIEPFTQLKKVELEKMCQEYRDKIDENTLPKKER